MLSVVDLLRLNMDKFVNHDVIEMKPRLTDDSSINEARMDLLPID